MPRPALVLPVLVLVIGLSACSRSKLPSGPVHVAVAAVPQSSLRELNGIHAFTLRYETAPRAPFAVGNFTGTDLLPDGIEEFEAFFQYPKIAPDTRYSLRSLGTVKTLWQADAFPVPPIEAFYAAITSTKRTPDDATTLNPLFWPKFTAIFLVPDRVYQTPEINRPVGGDLTVYEIPAHWAEHAVAFLSRGEQADDSINDSNDNVNPVEVAVSFSKNLRRAEQDPQALQRARETLVELIEAKGDPRLIEALFYLAIHPASAGASADTFLDLLKTTLRSGALSPQSGGVLYLGLVRLAKLPEKQTRELRLCLPLAEPTAVADKSGVNLIASEDVAFITLLRQKHRLSRIPPPEPPSPPPLRITLAPPENPKPPRGSDAPPDEANLHTGHYADEWGRTLPFRLFVPTMPRAPASCPLIVYLHALEGRGSDNRAHIVDAPDFLHLVSPRWQKKHHAFLVAPQMPEHDYWADDNAEDPSPAGALVLEIIDQLIQQYPAIDRRRIYLTGHSAGGAGTLDLAWKNPGRFAAAVPIASAWYPMNIRRETLLPIWFVVAEEDAPIRSAQSPVLAKIREHGGHAHVTTVTGPRPQSWIQGYRDPALISWLYQQRLPAEPTDP